jgi:sulfur transfer complex TusBCD TusB component (DsrH family)
MDSYNAHSPFTIRLELLKLAQSIESDRLFAERNRLEQDWHATIEDYGRRGLPTPSYPNVPVVTYEDVVRVAEELNKFVSNKG